MYTLRTLLPALGPLVVCSHLALAQEPVVMPVPPSSAGASYWTPQRIMNAKAVKLPKNSAFAAPNAQAPLLIPDAAAASQGQSSPASPPTIPANQIQGLSIGATLTPEQMQGLVPTTTMDLPDASSFFGLPFTTSQVQPMAVQVTFPFAATGKLLFTEQGVGDQVCSAAVVRINIVITAGHCVAHASTFFSAFL